MKIELWKQLYIMIIPNPILAKNTHLYSFIVVCLEIEMRFDGEKDKERLYEFLPRWSLGTCSGVGYELITGNHSRHYLTSTSRCCLNPGLHTLLCYSSPPARGWRNWYILVDGHRYCDDFVSYTSLQKIAVESMYLGLNMKEMKFF